MVNFQSSPSTIANYTNYLKKYINTSDFNSNSTCLDVILDSGKFDLGAMTKDLGDYNLRNISSVKKNPPTYQEKIDFSKPCPRNYISVGGGQCQATPDYKGICPREMDFSNFSAREKAVWGARCGTQWPIKRIEIPPQKPYTCSIDRLVLKDTGLKASGKIDGMKKALRYGKGYGNFAIDSFNRLFVADKISQLTRFGKYDKRCGSGNRMRVYEVDLRFFRICEEVNENLNQANINIPKTAEEAKQLYNDYKKLQNPNWEKEYHAASKENSVYEIKDNLNEMVQNLAKNYNLKTEIYNQQVDIINRNRELLDKKNSKIQSQLDVLNDIERQIMNKTRLEELNQEQINKTEKIRSLMIGSFVLFAFMVIPFVLFFTKTINPQYLAAIIILMIVGYVIYALVIVNKYKVKQFTKPIFKTLSKYENALVDYYNREKGNLRKNLSDYVYGDCVSGEEIPSEESQGQVNQGNQGNQGKMNVKDLVLNSNQPYYYFDGSAPPEQVFPKALGQTNFVIGQNIYKFPKELEKMDKEIENPIERMFFLILLISLNQEEISYDDPRLKKDLQVIDYEATQEQPLPYWSSIKLPLATNLSNNVGYMVMSYDNVKQSPNSGTFLVDTYNFFFGDLIPQDIFEKWSQRIDRGLKQGQKRKDLYQKFIDYLFDSDRFKAVYKNKFEFYAKKAFEALIRMNANVGFSESQIEPLN